MINYKRSQQTDLSAALDAAIGQRMTNCCCLTAITFFHNFLRYFANKKWLHAHTDTQTDTQTHTHTATECIIISQFGGLETAALRPSYTAVHRRRSGLPCCRRSHLEQSASTRHIRTLYVCFPRMLEGFPLQAFLSLTRYLNSCSACAVTVVIFGHLNRLFTYLPTYPWRWWLIKRPNTYIRFCMN